MAVYTPAGSGKKKQKEKTAPESGYRYDAAADTDYMQALSKLQAAEKEAPRYAGTYAAQLDSLYEEIANRGGFRFDLNADELYEQYRDQYAKAGQMAMRDTVGQAAALTGGYGSTYAEAAGQQAYDLYLQQLNEVVPELYGMALERYNAEGDRLQQQYDLLGTLADKEYRQYEDALTQYDRKLSYLADRAENAYDRGYENWYNAQKTASDAERYAGEAAYKAQQDAYEKQLDAYDRLAELITQTGYTPTEKELSAAGMSRAQAKAYGAAYTQKNTPKSSSSAKQPAAGGEKKKSPAAFTGSTYKEAVTYLKKNGAAEQTAGVLSESEWSRQKAELIRYRPEVFSDGNSTEYRMYGRGYAAYLKDAAARLVKQA